MLTFEYTFEYDEDEVLFAYSLPYTFSMTYSLLSQVADL